MTTKVARELARLYQVGDSEMRRYRVLLDPLSLDMGHRHAYVVGLLRHVIEQVAATHLGCAERGCWLCGQMRDALATLIALDTTNAASPLVALVEETDELCEIVAAPDRDGGA